MTLEGLELHTRCSFLSLSRSAPLQKQDFADSVSDPGVSLSLTRGFGALRKMKIIIFSYCMQVFCDFF